MQKMVLIVDDERGIADTMVAMLEIAGYTARAAYSAKEALAVLRTNQPALIISDVIMPGMNGVELSIQVRTLCPGAKILLMSGNAATQEIVDAVGVGHDFEVLAKPVPPRQLLAKVASVLDNRSDGTVFAPE